MIKQKLANNPLVYLFTKTWKYSEGNRNNVRLFWIMFIIANMIKLLIEPFVVAKMMNIIQREGITKENFNTLILLLITTACVEFVFWCFHGPARVKERSNAFKVRANYRKYLLRGIMGLPMEWHVDHHSGDTIDKVEKGTTAIYSFAEDSFEVIYSIVQLVISYSMLVYFSQSSAYIVLAMMLVSMWITMRFDKILVGKYKELSRSENKISESVFDAISNISTVIILRVERIVFKTIMRKVNEPYDTDNYTVSLSEMKWFLTSMCCKIMTVLVLTAYFWKVAQANSTVLIGSVFILITYLDRIEDVFFRFTGMYSDILKRRARLQNSEDLSKDFKDDAAYNHVLPSNWKELGVSNLCFSYHTEGEKDLHLNNISLKIRRGEKIAFVGKSGSGKTTLLKLFRDLYHPSSLTLTVDGVYLPDGFNGISQAVALVPQNPEIFATTILQNITLGAEYTAEVVQESVDMACFSGVVEKLPKKYESSVNEKGVNLSGGQQQRLALARGLLACSDPNKSIILLDEPTSSLDTATERDVYRNIFEGFVGKTIISSIHRLHLLSQFDRVVMFHEGKVIADGTLHELLQSCAEFQELWRNYSEAA